MKWIKRLTVYVLTVILIFSLDALVSVVSAKDIPQVKRGQIDFDDISVGVLNRKHLVLRGNNKKGNKEIKELEELISTTGLKEKDIIDIVNNNEAVCAIGYASADVLEYADGKMEYATNEQQESTSLFSTKASASTSKQSGTAKKKNLTLCTRVTKEGYRQTINGKKIYNYLTQSFARWNDVSFFQGGSDYQTKETDYLLQALPSSLTILNDSVSCRWFSLDIGLCWNSIPKNGGNVWRTNGGDHYVKWNIDGVQNGGREQIEQVDLSVNSKGQSLSKTRRISSYYVHTWTDTSLKVTPSISTTDAKLEIVPSNQAKSWQLYSYVTYSF